MGYPTKIATCCYCGTRAALVLGRDRHELSCSNCGAPLHDMKRFRQEPEPVMPRRTHAGESRRPLPERPAERTFPRVQAPRPKRRRLMRYLIREAIDVLEDIFD
jgi:hypothetical protein